MLQDVLSRIPDKPAKESLPAQCTAFLRRHAVPEELVATVVDCAYRDPIRIGALTLYRLAELHQDNEEDGMRPCIENGFLVVGFGQNGDAVALELRSGRMAFISHAELWERTYEQFADLVVRSPHGFHAFWDMAAVDPTFPVDIRDAEEQWGKQVADDSAG